MRLFVFEGEKREVKIFKTIKELFLDKNGGGNIVCRYGNLVFLYEYVKDMQTKIVLGYTR